MKKRAAVLMTACLLTAAMTGCADPARENAKRTENAEVKAESVEANSESGSEKTSQEAVDRKASDFKVAMMIPGNLGDKSFFDASYDSIELLKNDLGVSVDYVEAGADISKYHSVYTDLCEQDYDLILTVSSNGDDAMVQAAEEYPDKKFINLDDSLTEVPENVLIMAPKNNEMSYLAGVTAALKAQELGEKQVGFIGGMDIPGINEFLAGYIEGVQYIDPEIKVATSYVGSFTDTAKGKENALLLYKSGVPIIFAAAGQSGLGVIDAAAEKGKLVIGVDSDQAMALKESQPELAEVVVTSAIKNIPDEAKMIVDKAMKGDVEYGQRILFGIKDNAVGLAENEYYEKMMSVEQRQKVEEVKNGIISGVIKVTDTTGMSTEELEKIREAARP
ncbi:MAG: BMP family ABC transporter substrate-binding protein [Bacillota bacterium]|nr:BMP family ABC transporter substrate-binding protein [Bacillota bacterium]